MSWLLNPFKLQCSKDYKHSSVPKRNFDNGFRVAMGSGPFHFISYTLFHIQDIKKDMRITNCMIHLALSWKKVDDICYLISKKEKRMCFIEMIQQMPKDCYWKVKRTWCLEHVATVFVK